MISESWHRAPYRAAWATRSLPGELANGDGVAVVDGAAWLAAAVVDGTGHGPEAAEAARLALSTIQAWAVDGQELGGLVSELQVRLKGSRGVAATVVAVREAELVGFGVGNVVLRSRGCDFAPVLTPGILGRPLRRRIREFEVTIPSGARLLFYSDGIRSGFDVPSMETHSPQECCRELLEQRARPQDDATVMVLDRGESA